MRRADGPVHVRGDVEVTGNLTVNGALQVDSLATKRNVTVGGDLDVKGVFSKG